MGLGDCPQHLLDVAEADGRQLPPDVVGVAEGPQCHAAPVEAGKRRVLPHCASILQLWEQVL